MITIGLRSKVHLVATMRSFCKLMSLLLVFSVLTGCRTNQDLLRYGDVSCAGYFASSYSTRLPDGVDLRAGIPAHASFSGLQLTWLHDDALFVVYDIDNTLHLIDRSGQLVASRDHDRSSWSSAATLASNNLGTYALSRADGALDMEVTEVHAYDPVSLEEGSLLDRILRLELPAWHPTEQVLAGKYYNADAFASNIIAIFDTTRSAETPVALLDLDWSDVGRVLGWSGDGQMIAANQFRKSGLTPVYIDRETGAFAVSSLNNGFNNCVTDGEWSPNDRTFAFPGQVDSADGYDIYIEKVGSVEEGQSELVNLTNTPKEDEQGLSWSPDGRQVAFFRGYLDESGTYQQELARISVDQDPNESIQLTFTDEEFETAPLWISANEIAYLSWDYPQSKWFLRTLSVTSPEQQPRRVMEIPDSWYRTP